jgi:hypothetical protein
MEVLCVTQSLERAKEVYQKFKLTREYKTKAIHKIEPDVEYDMNTFYNNTEVVETEEFKHKTTITYFTIQCWTDKQHIVNVFTSTNQAETQELYDKLDTPNKQIVSFTK